MNRTETIAKRRAFARLLLGTTILAGATFGAHAQDAADDQTGGTVLEAVVVEGSTYETEGTGSYATKLISVGDKDTRPLREVPQSTTVLTRERLDDGNFTSLDTAMRKTPGVVVLTNDDGRSSLYSRGFEYDTLYMNGLSTPVSSIYGTQPDMAVVDHVEILRGPSGLFGGAGEPAGAVNMRLKQPSDEYKASVNTTIGSWDGKRIEGDVTGPLVKSGRVRGRLVGVLSTKDSWVDKVDNKVGVLYGTVEADITDNTTARFSINHTERDITPFNGLPTLKDGTLLDLNRSTYTGADWNTFENSVTQYIAEIEHKFDDGGHAKISALYSHVDVNFLYAYASSFALANGDINGGGNADTRWLARDYEQDSVSLDAHISRPFDLFGLENNIIAGVDYRGSDDTLYSATGTIVGRILPQMKQTKPASRTRDRPGRMPKGVTAWTGEMILTSLVTSMRTGRPVRITGSSVIADRNWPELRLNAQEIDERDQVDANIYVGEPDACAGTPLPVDCGIGFDDDCVFQCPRQEPHGSCEAVRSRRL